MQCSIYVELISYDGVELRLQCQQNKGHEDVCSIPVPYRLKGHEAPVKE